MYGYIYLTTNLINNKKYIGKHRSEKFDDSYKGSGKILWIAIKKYGWDNFKTEIIDTAETLEELNNKEIYYISEYNAQKSSDFYNICKGGEAGPGGPMFKGHKHSEETKAQMSIHRSGSNNSNYGNHWTCSEELKSLHSKLSSGVNNGMYGKKHSDYTKEKISNSRKGCKGSLLGVTGEKHPAFGLKRSAETKEKIGTINRGTKWYNNGIKQVRSTTCPKGFVEGMLKNK